MRSQGDTTNTRFGTARKAWWYSGLCVNAQTLPARNLAARASAILGPDWPASNYTDTANAGFWLFDGDMPADDHLELYFIGYHASDASSKAGSARLFWAGYDQQSIGQPAGLMCGDHLVDFAVATSASPPVALATGSKYANGSDAAVLVDAASANNDNTPSGVLTKGVSMTRFKFDYWGYRRLFMAVNIGNFKAIRVVARTFS